MALFAASQPARPADEGGVAGTFQGAGSGLASGIENLFNTGQAQGVPYG